MATLYEIDERLANIFVTPEGTAVDGSTGEVLDTKVLDDLEMEKWSKVDNICRYIKNLQSDIEQYKEEVDKLTARAVSAQKKLESLKAYLAMHLEAGKKADVPSAQIRWRKSVTVSIPDENMVPMRFMKQVITTKPDKLAIKELLKAGKAVPGASLEEKQNLSIK